MCDYCGKWFDQGVKITWKAEKLEVNYYCLKDWPEVEAAARKLPWYKGYNIKMF